MQPQLLSERLGVALQELRSGWGETTYPGPECNGVHRPVEDTDKQRKCQSSPGAAVSDCEEQSLAV